MIAWFIDTVLIFRQNALFSVFFKKYPGGMLPHPLQKTAASHSWINFFLVTVKLISTKDHLWDCLIH